jgi:hypothetical protein
MMSKQMELFEEGGLKDEGGMIDAESGNEVPVGSTREEVRDDIPAKLSEGEFVMPADVVRYHGLDKMMALRDEAKMGLRKMEAMGQMGNSDEATLPEEMPFGMADLIVVAEDGKEVEMAEGGYVTMANGGDPSRNVRQLGATYTPPTNQPINFTRVMGDGGISFKQYRNAKGENLLVSFVGGIPITPIPEGYTEYTPGTEESITPVEEAIQEVVRLSPPTPVADEEDRQRAGYEEGYSIGIENMTADQLIEENRRRNSPFAKVAIAVASTINPFAGIMVIRSFKQGDEKIEKRADELGLKNLANEVKNKKSIIGGVTDAVAGIVGNVSSTVGQFISSIFNDEEVSTAEKDILKVAPPPMRPTTAFPARTSEPTTSFPRQITGPITGGIQPESRADITPAVSGSGGQISPFMAALRGGFDSATLDRERGILPSGVEVASAGELTNEQLRQLGQGYMTAGDRYAMGYGGRGLQGSRPEGFGSQDLGYDPTVDPRGPSQIPDRTRPFPNYNYESNMRDRNMRPPSGTPKFYDAFGNETISMGQGSSRESTDIPFDSGTRYVQDFIDDAASADANVARIPYADPGAYTFAPPFGRQDAMGQFPASPINVVPRNMQGPNFTPDGIDPRGQSQIPDSRRPFPPSVPYDASFPREPAVPANVSQTDQAFGSLFRDQRADRAARDFASGVGSTGAQISETPAFEPAADPRVPYTPSPIIARADERNFVQPDTRARAIEANARRNAAAEQGLLTTQLERGDPYDFVEDFNMGTAPITTTETSDAGSLASALAGKKTKPSLDFAPSAAETQEAMLGAEGTGMTPAESNLRSQRAKLAQEARDADLNYRLQNQREFLAEDARTARTTPRTTANVTESQLTLPDNTMFGTDDLKTTTTQPVDDTKKLKTTAKTVNMFGDTVTKGQKGSDEYLFDRTEVAAKEKAYKDKVNSIEFDTRGRDTLLRSGKVVAKNAPQAVYNREQEETGYIGTDSEGYGVGMIAGPGSAGVVVDADGKAKKTSDRKTIFQDSKGVQYTKSTFGKRETLDGKAYTPAEGAKRGDGADRDNDGEADESKIICTAMNASYGFGSYRQAIWLNYSNKHLTKAHEVGYHTLFLPLVHLAYTKNNKLIRKILEHGTRRRTADLRAELKGTKRNTLGRFYRSIFEPLCYGVGKIKMVFGE